MDGFILIDQPRSGVENMALDQAMVERAAREHIVLARIYQWSVPTLSLGYFQRLSDRSEKPDTLTMDVVRRSTGGGAIVHHFDWTYSIAVPSDLSNGSSTSVGASAPLYDLVHNQVVKMLDEFQLAAQLSQGTSRQCGKCSFLCFERHSRGDVLVGEHKVLGSAQRRIPGGLLQHGSLLLATSPFARSLVGICELVEKNIDTGQLSDRFHAAIGEAINQYSIHGLNSPTGPVWLDEVSQLLPNHKLGDYAQFDQPAWTNRLP